MGRMGKTEEHGVAGLAPALRCWLYRHLVIEPIGLVLRGLRHLPRNNLDKQGIEVIRDVPYLEDAASAQRLDVYRPRDADQPLPVVIHIHGGGFKYFSKETHWAVAARFARAGALTFNVNYRTAPENGYPAAVEDAAAAYAWVVEHAQQYGGDLSRLVLAGESAGANLVLGLVIASSWRHEHRWARQVWDCGVGPAVILPACGYLEVSRPERHDDPTRTSKWVVGRIFQVSDDYLPGHADPGIEEAFANPLVMLEEAGPPERPLPACFALVGGRDPVAGDTLRLHAAMQGLHADCALKVYDKGGHAFHLMQWRELADEAWRDQFAFLAQHAGDCWRTGESDA